MNVQISTLGAIVGLCMAIFLIIRKFQPVYSLMLGALVGGLVGGLNLTETVEVMMSGAKDISPSILRVLTSGVLAGILIKTGAVDKISEEIIRVLGKKHAILALALSAMILAGVGVNLDVAIITVSPIALSIGKKLNYSKLAILLAMVGGGKAGNIISPNPNTIAISENFNIDLVKLMFANFIPSIFGLIVTIIICNLILFKGDKIQEEDLQSQREDLPSFTSAIIGPLSAIILLSLGTFTKIQIDPLIALPLGGFIGLISMKKVKFFNEYMSYGLSKMVGVAILLLGTGTLAGIIKNSEVQQTTINLLNMLDMPEVLLAPISGMLMSLATASSTAGATIASATFADTIIGVGISPIAGGAMINAGSSVFEHLPHGSLFHSSAGGINMRIEERFKLIPYEIIVGFIMTMVSTIIYGLF
ncbi:GntP family permease [Paraclostridium sordellii]|uniref:GntP family permease n=1 Tax=Paraclostridium sordellii TaxID=1505 RepID=UPI000385654A|nr:SLC13 family permease [Paeniclostridium sordellii]EPZ62493.1 dctM-like transporters family protein [[Clostridium] sordellii VPI 9048] [Paeniclostridium sordellii VPI 9048]MBS6022802.1 GntP family permease [Paeniclostridium sordellii]MBX9179865.1 GntP family permease [Paeniclostridium sordellii]MDU1455380.1 SLC13 family permease [Paeniclostridium sordellii]MDU6481199.1 SLC13 family permease [Paeniclostridium sordellii]